jgi:hemerythrin-like metal-binding protein
MPPLHWKPEYSVGDPAVDHEHRELIDLVNVALGAILEGDNDVNLEEALGDVFRAISAHFAHEERQMRSANYDQYAQHKAEHERLLDALRDIMDENAESVETAPTRLTAALESWFLDHFKTHDARLHRRLGPHH